MARFNLAKGIWSNGLVPSVVAFSLLASAAAFAQQGYSKSAEAASANRLEKQGIVVEFSIAPLEAASGSPGSKRAVIAGEAAVLRFAITDGETGAPIKGLYPAGWMDNVTGAIIGNVGDAAIQDNIAGVGKGPSCKEKVGSYLQGRMGYRPQVDLNNWYILAMNEKASISVIDPLLGYGGQKMLALVLLNSPGEDWVLSKAEDRLFVAMPRTDEIAIIDTARWKVAKNIFTGPKPTRVALQPDGAYLWVGLDALPGTTSGGVAVIDARTLELKQRIFTGSGHHELAFTEDSRYAFVSNTAEGTVTVIDIAGLTTIKQVRTGSNPRALAYSTLRRAVYVTDPDDGSIVAIDATSHEITARVKVEPGVGALTFTADGRFGFVPNPKTDRVAILDASVDQIVRRIAVDPRPDQVAVTRSYAYVRSLGSDRIMMIDLASVRKGGEISAIKIPGGRRAPGESRHIAAAPVIVVTPEKTSVLIANPADRAIYYHMEGMNAPSGSYSNEQRQPKAVLVVDKGLLERTPGVYSTNLLAPRAGIYDVAFLLDTPRIVHCFRAEVKPNPNLRQTGPGPVKVEFLTKAADILAGETSTLRFKLADEKTGKPRGGVKDISVLTFRVPGDWQKRVVAKPIGDGVYEMTLRPPTGGIYYVYLGSRTLGLSFSKRPDFILRLQDKKASRSGAGERGKKNKS